MLSKLRMGGVAGVVFTGAVAFAAITGQAQAVPMNFSFAGTFNQDDNVQLFNFTADGASIAYIVSYGYGGGTQANGAVHSQGGFDTILTLFDSTGALVDSNDDGDSQCFIDAAAIAGSGGNADSNTGMTYDTCFSAMLAAGDYTVAVTQFDSFAVGPNLSDGFDQDGNGNFTAINAECTQGSFCDVSETPTFTNRTNFWAYDILNVGAADQVSVPEPAALGLFGLGLAGLGLAARRGKSA